MRDVVEFIGAGKCESGRQAVVANTCFLQGKVVTGPGINTVCGKLKFGYDNIYTEFLF